MWARTESTVKAVSGADGMIRGPESGTTAPVGELAAAGRAQREIERIAEVVLAGAESVDDEVKAFNEKTGHDYVALDFTEYDGSRSQGEFASP
ncbi:hypothetical protein ACWEQL_28555 [Kitasatospora sp. NPDC004240]